MAQRKRLNIWWNPQRCCNYRIHQRARFANQLTLPLFSHDQSLWRGHRGHVQSIIANTATKASGLCCCVVLSAGWMAQTCWQGFNNCLFLPVYTLLFYRFGSPFIAQDAFKVPTCTRSTEAVCLWCVYWYAMNVQKTRFCSLGFQAVGTNMVYTHDIPETETYIACMCVQKQTLLRFMIYTLNDKYMHDVSSCNSYETLKTCPTFLFSIAPSRPEPLDYIHRQSLQAVQWNPPGVTSSLRIAVDQLQLIVGWSSYNVFIAFCTKSWRNLKESSKFREVFSPCQKSKVFQGTSYHWGWVIPSEKESAKSANNLRLLFGSCPSPAQTVWWFDHSPWPIRRYKYIYIIIYVRIFICHTCIFPYIEF